MCHATMPSRDPGQSYTGGSRQIYSQTPLSHHPYGGSNTVLILRHEGKKVGSVWPRILSRRRAACTPAGR